MQGRIIGNISNQYQVEVENTIYRCHARGKFKNENISPVVGDKVEITLLEEEKKEGMIEEILPRINYSKRPKMSNLTQILFVLSCKNPKPDLLLLDKQLAYAEYLGVQSVIILNKIDLDKEQQVKQIQDIYEKIGYKVIITNAKDAIGIEQVKEVLKKNVSAFSGNSGVGKSTLINAILKREVSEEGDISKKNKKGKNTTTTIGLYALQEDAYIADTPGFSTFDIHEIHSEELANYFREMKNHIVECEYVGCRHIKEKECGIKKAVEEGKISKQRYLNFVKIYEELKEKEEHKW